MLRLVLLCVLLTPLRLAYAQTTVFLFEWEGTDPLVATIGPNASSVGNKTSTKLREDGNTKGIAPPTIGNGNKDITLILNDNVIFNVPGIDLSFDYQQDDATNTLVQRGSFRMGVNGMNITYRVENGTGGGTTVSSPNFPIPNDDVYRTYRFRYEPGVGNAVLSVDGAQLWTNPIKTPGRSLYWVGDGNIVVGTLLDGNSLGKALLDNLRMEEVVASASLPIELVWFDAEVAENQVHFSWRTARETDNAYFVIERSASGSGWQEIGTTPGSGTSVAGRTYTYKDTGPMTGTNYYRLKQVDYDGTYQYSAVRSVVVAKEEYSELLYPNPTRGKFTVRNTSGSSRPQLFDARGRKVSTVNASTTDGFLHMNISELPDGVYYLRSGSTVQRLRKH
ncbi:hypothetical protein LEM8419_02301 [Neolewinella maritima]|uniref:Secretion system C-terminal sorting domain-containing protein n=1 Tax=Neolewinella maritima TaxID=1383882 RepID=A0ABN8F357_9BACT|nr:T9SS type A sorting domain-containing protein [Neolewinella maritima]CAH1001398.1 hypothetical protein LEM8419_02301 [Neolewinella maritima]